LQGYYSAEKAADWIINVKEDTMKYDDLMELFKNRRSIRKFKGDPIPDEDVDRIIEAARFAPSGFNTQPWEFVVIKNKELKDKIVHVIDEYKITQFDTMESFRESWQGVQWKRAPKDQGDYRNAPVFIVLFGDTRTKLGLPMAVRYTHHKRESIFNSSLANTFMYMHLAANALGLGTQWVTAVQMPQVNCFLKNLLGIPNELETYDMMVLGYPDMIPKPKFLREKEEMVHFDYCGEKVFRTDEQVKDFIRRTRNWALAVNPMRQSK
jgi:nitroreductase